MPHQATLFQPGKRNLAALLVGAALAATSPWILAQTAAKRQRVVIQVSDAEPAKWNLALNNAKNIQDELGAAQVDIDIVAFGPGLGALRMEANNANRVADLAKSGVQILACENTMRNQKLSKADMNAAIGYVNAGAVHIMQRQSDGWAYLRP